MIIAAVTPTSTSLIFDNVQLKTLYHFLEEAMVNAYEIDDFIFDDISDTMHAEERLCVTPIEVGSQVGQVVSTLKQLLAGSCKHRTNNETSESDIEAPAPAPKKSTPRVN